MYQLFSLTVFIPKKRSFQCDRIFRIESYGHLSSKRLFFAVTNMINAFLRDKSLARAPHNMFDDSGFFVFISKICKAPKLATMAMKINSIINFTLTRNYFLNTAGNGFTLSCFWKIVAFVPTTIEIIPINVSTGVTMNNSIWIHHWKYVKSKSLPDYKHKFTEVEEPTTISQPINELFISI